MTAFRVTLTFKPDDPRRPQEFLQQHVLPLVAELEVLDSKIRVVDPPNPASPAAQHDGQQSLDVG